MQDTVGTRPVVAAIVLTVAYLILPAERSSVAAPADLHAAAAETTPGTPSHVASQVVAALKAGQVDQVMSFFVSEQTFGTTTAPGHEYEQFRKAFEDSIRDLLRQDLPLAEMEFVQIDFRFCREPIVVPKGQQMAATADVVLYDNLRVVVSIAGAPYAFKIDAMILDQTDWRLISPIQWLGPWTDPDRRPEQRAARPDGTLPWAEQIDLNLAKVLQAPQGTVADLEHLKGNVVVLEFWATWCGPCIQTMPQFNQLADQCRDDPIKFIAITNEDEQTVVPFLAKTPIHAWIGLDQRGGGNGVTFRQFGVTSIPHTIVIDPNGFVVGHTLVPLLTRDGLLNLSKARPYRPGPGDAGRHPANDQERLQGLWRAVQAEVHGRAAPKADIKEFRILIKGNSIIFNPDHENRKSTFQLDPTKKPKTIDLAPADGPAKGETLPAGIYAFKGDQLWLCLNNGSNKERPSDFKTGPGDEFRLLILKRVSE